MPPKKIDLVRAHITAGECKKALAIIKTFKPLRGVASKQEIETMTLAYECLVHPEFYRAIGRDVDATIQTGINRMLAIYGQN
jgi:hypothetical protein